MVDLDAIRERAARNAIHHAANDRHALLAEVERLRGALGFLAFFLGKEAQWASQHWDGSRDHASLISALRIAEARAHRGLEGDDE